MFVTFSEAQPDLAFEEAEDGAEDDDEAARAFSGPRAVDEPPVWDEGEAPAAVAESLADREKRSRPTAKRGTKSKRQKHDPESERASQLAAGKATGKPNGAAHP